MSRFLLSTLLGICIALPTQSANYPDYKSEIEALKGQVNQLESELKALRKQLQDFPPPPKKPSAKETSDPNGNPTPSKKQLYLTVETRGFGDAAPVDIKAVCLSTAHEFLPYFPQRQLNPISIRGSDHGPMVLFSRGPQGEYRVLLNVKGRYWAQCTYQFAHEFCHILCNYREVKNPNLWFEESLCETASLFALRKMAKTWRTKAPYPNWKSYAPALAHYAENRMGRLKLPQGMSLAQWYRRNEPELRKTGTDRNRNQIVAEALLPLFEKHPHHWQAVSYLNKGKAGHALSFREYLTDWYKRASEEHRPFIARIAGLFEIPVVPEKKLGD